MKRVYFLLPIVLFGLTILVSADTVILRDGSSYSGQSAMETVNFTDQQGVKYEFPVKDVQSIAFSTGKDTVVLRNGRNYSGQFAGLNPIGFQDAQGIKYQFPTSDIDAVVFSRSGPMPPAVAAGSLVIPIGADLPVRTNETIDSNDSYQGQTYSGTITEDIQDTDGNIAIPAGSPAQLVIRKVSSGGLVHSAELVLDLDSVTVHKRVYRVVASDVAESNRQGMGANRRTAEFLGGGSALGALMGGIFGGGKGAGIGALTGAGGGAVTQAFTRGKEVRVPAESVLRFRLQKTLILRPA